MSEGIEIEFSRHFDVAGLGAAPRQISLKARPEEREALARRLGLEAIESLTAEIALQRESAELIELEGAFKALVIQTCVVSNEPFEAEVEESFSRRYLQGRAARQVEVDIDPEAEDPPEPIGPEGLDLGEVVAEELSLALDPYPRKPGTEPLDLSSGETGEEETEEKQNPFAVLAEMKGKKPS